MEQKVEQAIDRVDHFRERLCDTLTEASSEERRTTAILSWFDLSSETHEAITILMRKDLNGPAYALVRNVWELFVRSAWVATCATEEQRDKILNVDNFKFPKMESMTEVIDEKLKENAFIDRIRKNLWQPMNSFTHGGLLQLSRRVHGRRIKSNYEDAERIEVIEHVTMTLLLHGLLLSSVPEVRIEGKAIVELIKEWDRNVAGRAAASRDSTISQ